MGVWGPARPTKVLPLTFVQFTNIDKTKKPLLLGVQGNYFPAGFGQSPRFCL